MFAIRSLIEASKLALGITQPPLEHPRPALFHKRLIIGELPIRKLKAYAAKRSPILDIANIHVTGVRGGFGVGKSAVKRWAEWLVAPSSDKRYPILRAAVNQLHANGMTYERLAVLLAQAERFRDTPYHEVGTQAGFTFANRDLSQRTKHGGPGGNDGMGIAFDTDGEEVLTPAVYVSFQLTLESALNRMLSVGDRSRTIRVRPHRSTGGMRGADPGALVWRNVVLPVLDDYPNVVVDYDYRHASGLFIPRSWDPSAHYDDRGKRVT